MNTLKTILIVTIISLFTFSCSSDDDNSNPSNTPGSTTANQAALIGTWKFTSSSVNGVTDTNFWICDFEETYQITDNTITINYYADPSGNDGGNCELEGSNTTNYSISGNTITVEGYAQEITTLNATTLVLKEIYEGDTYTETYTKQ